ncbi:Hypothetical protein EUBREC_0370 [Agathobacter rectalis ATCC 33656]|uniref:Uncharacterized protein n=1 Tax=Agathobacter rectalis (strain ATCC 33656 / DSM 3377 / JCM 17463 / KCTC 5835 / VPI 0990) TaxID=515619 RepID=C4ZB86_AGARV|nr:Hypothetical protein EUBREC_0370 [Agathobacter rectalis ATCC 33656]
MKNSDKCTIFSYVSVRFIKINCCRTYKKVQTAALFKRICNKF